MKYPFYKPAQLDTKQLARYIDGINDRRHYTNNGPLVRELTAKLQEWLGVERLLLVSSGTVALQIAYKALSISGNAYTTPLSFVATTSALKWLGVNPRFSDIDQTTLNLDPGNLATRPLRSGDVAVATHLYGNPCDITEFERLADRTGLKVIYDASHAFSTQYRGKSVMAAGDASAVSFHATKLFHTIEGGAITFASESSYKNAKQMINFGFEEGGYAVQSVGINAKMSELHAAVGLISLESLNGIIEKRAELLALYKAKLDAFGDFFIKAQPGTDYSAPSYMPFVLESAKQRDQLSWLLQQEGIETRKYFESLLTKLPYCTEAVKLPTAERFENRVLCLPLYPDLCEADIVFISEKILSLLPQCKN